MNQRSTQFGILNVDPTYRAPESEGSAQAAKKEMWLTNLTSALAVRMPAPDHAGAALHVTIALSAFDWAMARWLVDPAQDLSRIVDEAFQLVRATFDGAEPGL